MSITLSYCNLYYEGFMTIPDAVLLNAWTKAVLNKNFHLFFLLAGKLCDMFCFRREKLYSYILPRNFCTTNFSPSKICKILYSRPTSFFPIVILVLLENTMWLNNNGTQKSFPYQPLSLMFFLQYMLYAASELLQ